MFKIGMFLTSIAMSASLMLFGFGQIKYDEPASKVVNVYDSDFVLNQLKPRSTVSFDLQRVEPIVISKSDLDLISLVVMAEAEAESEYGKRMVIDVILNRVDSEHFPDTVSDVIHQRNQFTSMWNGRVSRCRVDTEISRLVVEEIKSRTNNEVIFFTAGRYSQYGVPMVRVEHHYFSSYKETN